MTTKPDVPFVRFPSIKRISRECVVTEKLDGTNAQVFVTECGEVFSGSRQRWLAYTISDNYGFGRWVHEHREQLRELGPGAHYGEWWGAGIQRRYGLTEKRFSLFDTSRWSEDTKPACCHVVPVLYRGLFSTDQIDACLEDLKLNGSKAAPGFAHPEGVVAYHTATGTLFKKTLDGDGHKTR